MSQMRIPFVSFVCICMSRVAISLVLHRDRKMLRSRKDKRSENAPGKDALRIHQIPYLKIAVIMIIDRNLLLAFENAIRLA